jgi:hypothetical protein
MTRRSPVAPHGQFQGQILLERALFCVGCELIFAGTASCPRCGSGEAVWPLAEWLRSTRSASAAARPRLAVSAEPSAIPPAQRAPSAA